jgi:hypothetical protein
MVKLAAVFALLMLGMAQTRADQISAANLADYCNALDNASNSTCRGYILGVVQGLRIAAKAANDTRHFCMPSDLPEGQLVALFEEMVRENPADLNQPAAAIVAAAVVHTFPCPGAQESTNRKAGQQSSGSVLLR